MEKPLVSVLILNYRNPLATALCAEAFLRQTIAGECEILVIDNHSNDESVGLLRNRLGKYPQVRIIETPGNNGFGYGYNTGAGYASGKYLLINNPDKRMPDEGVEVLLSKLETDDSIGIIAPKLVHSDGTQRTSIRRFPRILDILARRSVLGRLFPGALTRYLMLDVDTNKEQDVDWVVGGCFCISRELFESIGGFDERFFLFFEDTDICRRVKEAGKRIVYTPDIVSSDKKNRLSGQSFFDLIFKKTGRIHVSSAFKYFWKWKSV